VKKQAKNKDIRDCAKDSGVSLWEIAVKLKIYDSTLSKRLRNELTKSEKLEIFAIIDELTDKEV
jgi:lambda repressor-like predicted transcriptional regulator